MNRYLFPVVGWLDLGGKGGRVLHSCYDLAPRQVVTLANTKLQTVVEKWKTCTFTLTLEVYCHP